LHSFAACGAVRAAGRVRGAGRVRQAWWRLQAHGVHHGTVTDRAMVSRRLAGYEAAWRAPGAADLFTNDATYLQSPSEQPITGLAAVRRKWDEKREGAGEVFTLATQILAVDRSTAVVRAEARYADPPRQEYRDL
jgi:hypothetical protein